MSKEIAVLFVCLGNICRSPAAEEILRQLNEQPSYRMNLHVESCGLGSWHVGHLPHDDMREAAGERGFILKSRAQQFSASFFERFDYILAADQSVLKELYRHAHTAEQKAKLHLITEYSAAYYRQEIPDPYSQGRLSFELVLDMLEEASQGFLNHLKITGS